MWGGRGRRGVSEVLGAILVFAILVSGVALYQVTVVPETNEQREFEHSQQVQQQMLDLRNDLQAAAVSGQAGSASLDLGASYPVRALTLNPPEGAGSIRTVGTDGSASIRVGNARATDPEVDDLWDGGTKTFETGTIRYEPSYTYYRNAPSIAYDNGILYAKFGPESNGEVIPRTDQDVVDGRSISLTALDGNRATSRTDAVAIEARPLSPATETIAVEGDGGPVRITIPTAIPESVWIQQLLVRQIDDAGDVSPALEGDETTCGDLTGTKSNGNDRYVVDCIYDENSDSLNELTLVFQETDAAGRDVRYSLSMSKVGVASDATKPGASYLTATEGNGSDVSLDGRQKIVFQVRDEFNNPTDGRTIDISLAGGGPGSLVYRGQDEGQSVSDVAVGPDGEVELYYQAPQNTMSSPISVDVLATFDGAFGSAPKEERARVKMQVINASRIDRTQPLLNPPEGIAVSQATADESSVCTGGTSDTCVLKVTLKNFDDGDGTTTSATITKLRYSFYKPDSQSSSDLAGSSELEIIAPTDNVGTSNLVLTGEFQTLDSSITLQEGQTETISFVVYEDPTATRDISPGDFFVISAIVDNERRTFFIAPAGAGGGGGGGGPSS